MLNSIKKIFRMIIAILFVFGLLMLFIGTGTRSTPMRDRHPEIALFGAIMALITLGIMIIPQMLEAKKENDKFKSLK